MKKTNGLGIFLLAIFSIGFIADAFFIKPENIYTDWGSDLRLFFLLLLWFFIGKIFNFSSIATLKLTLLFLVILSFSFIFFRDYFFTERLASWVYIYLAAGVIQQLLEIRGK
jgi:hypothetical protein